jgi:hypothetical protein
MSQETETVLCKCFICKGEYPELGGKYISKSTFRRHRNKESKWSNFTIIQNLNADINLNVNSVIDNEK